MTGAALVEALFALGPVGIVAGVGLYLIQSYNRRMDAFQKDANERSDRQFATMTEVADRYHRQSEKNTVALDKLITVIDERLPRTP